MPKRFERSFDGIKVAVWDHPHTSIFGTVYTLRVCQAWFGTTIGPDGLYGEARRTLGHRVKRLTAAGRAWYVIDRKALNSSLSRPPGAPLPRYFALTASDPGQIRFWLSDDRMDALRRTTATTLTPFDLRLVTRPGSPIDDAICRDLAATARLLI